VVRPLVLISPRKDLLLKSPRLEHSKEETSLLVNLEDSTIEEISPLLLSTVLKTKYTGKLKSNN
jgi:hypothetical protein